MAAPVNQERRYETSNTPLTEDALQPRYTGDSEGCSGAEASVSNEASAFSRATKLSTLGFFIRPAENFATQDDDTTPLVAAAISS